MLSSRCARWLVLFACWSALLCFGQGKRISEEQNERDQPREREQWFRRGRPSDMGRAAEKLHRAYEQKLAKQTTRRAQLSRQKTAVAAGSAAQRSAAIVPAPGAVWTPLGPSPLASDSSGFGSQDYGWVTGRATSVVVDQNDATGNTVYLGGAFGGLWKSTNAANPTVANVTWTPLIDGEATLAVGAVALKPNDSNIVIVGTGESNSSTDSYYGLGILRSAQGGAPGSWTLITSASGGVRPFRGLTFSRIAFSVDNPNLVVAATVAAGVSMGQEVGGAQSGTSCATNTSCRGMYYSTDAGVTWSYAASLRDTSGATPNVGSAHSVVYNPIDHRFYTALRAHGIYSSSDGANWTQTTAQPGGITSTNCPAATNLNTCPLYRAEIAVVPGRNEMYVWLVDSNENNKGIYQTRDSGAIWTVVPTSGIDNCGDGTNNGCGTEQGNYNLDLAAVPNGTATDLYAGAVNQFKCSIADPTNPATCTFVNLTHVYGCSPLGSYGHVHPDEHSIDFSRSDPRIVYFANDGGIYRTLNSFAAASGVCGSSPYPFENLNGTMGSMTQFVWFSHHPSDASTLLGGTQDNGSPATANGGTTQTWKNVNNGDGGYNEINPNTPTDWFTSNTHVSIQRCGSGINCTSGTFNGTVMGPPNGTALGSDYGSFYVPYMLDPQNSGTLLVGTCRVWRGNTSGSGFSALSSPNFNSANTAACAKGDATNPPYIPDNISALAAGGAKNSTTNNSQTIYAGTEHGKIWVTTNADGGVSTWQDRTQTINPKGYTISSLTLDPSDASGNTVYATIMGFDAGHVFRSVNAGSSWTDVSGDLPNAPADAVLVDPGDPSIVYVGTDVGVFVTTNGGTNWTELGLNGSGASTLPNVAITRMKIFTGGTTEHLRVSTYGRGIWDIDLGIPTTASFILDMPSSEISVLAGNQGTVGGTLQPIYGYNGNITVSCTGTTPATCTGGTYSNVHTPTTFTVAVGNPATGNFGFTIQARDTNGLTQTQNVTLHVADFTLGPSPASNTVKAGGTATHTITLTPAGSAANATAAFACSGLPSLSSCSFLPATLTVGSSAATTTLSISTTAPIASAPHRGPIFAFWLPLAALVVAGLGARRRKGFLLPLLLVLFALLLLPACGGGGNGGGGRPGTPPGTYTVTITGSMSSGGSTQGTRTTTVTLTVQ